MKKVKIKSTINSVSGKKPPHGKNSPNKVINLFVGNTRIAKKYPSKGIVILKPIIDRIVIRFDPTKEWGEDTKESFETCVYSYIHNHGQSDGWEYQYVPNDVQTNNQTLYRSYKKNLWLKHEATGERVLLQTDPKSAKTPFFRFDFNPFKLGYEGIKSLKEEVGFLMGATDFDLSYKDILEADEAIYRVDVAVDILGVDVDDLELQYFKHGSQTKQVKPVSYASETGRTQTVYPNALLSGSNKTYVYNKKASAEDKCKPPMFEGVLHSRFEHRYTKWNKPLGHLMNITVGKNPLKKMGIRWIDYSAIKEKDFSHVLFLQYAKTRGIDKALEIIPESEQEDYLETYEVSMLDIWNPSELWAHWPEVVTSYGLLNP